MITAHALTVKMAVISRMMNAAMTVIHNEKILKVGRDSSSDADDFSDRRRSTNLYRETIRHFGPSGTAFCRCSTVI